ncbi:exonuclease domain-containing protein [Indioceanicola profundi]|uniref:exonuclease domain-containing protein n=1 Tax=Indioceanicola profundi TaxID=2220096 RepID=UPI000E6A9980|nr:exonuclease domain-containing protein [Indioceanicola profundi]
MPFDSASAPIVAIDFETANEQRNSACAIGLSWVEDGRVVRTEEFLIRPPELRFTPFTIAVHGIRPQDVAHEPEFPDVWARLLPDLAGCTLIAHNASFDMGVLRAMLEHYRMDVPGHGFLCTLVTARRLWPELERHKLNHLAWHFGIELDHHKAGSDAQACAEIALRAMAHTGSASLPALALAAGVGMGLMGQEANQACRILAGKPRGNGAPPMKLPEVVRRSELAGCGIAFTGALSTLSRGEAEALACAAGLVPQTSVTRATDFLVVGRTTDSSKLRRARARADIDGRPRLVDEREYREMLGLVPAKAAEPA